MLTRAQRKSIASASVSTELKVITVPMTVKRQ